MRKLISTLVVSTFVLGTFATSASAGQRYNQRHNQAGDAILGAIIGGVIGGVIANEINNNRRQTIGQPRYGDRRQRFYTGPEFNYYGHSGVWGDASQYEAETGRICPFGGRKYYVQGMYICRVR